MPYSNSTYIPDDIAPEIQLRCGNVRIGFFMFCLILWLATATFLIGIASYTAIPWLAQPARAILAFFGHTETFMLMPISILGVMLYFIYGRKMLTWYNGVVIDDDAALTITHFQFKRLTPGITFIYLRGTNGRLYILIPTTSQDNYKFKNMAIVKREQAINQTQMQLLQTKLLAAGATEKKFRFFTTRLVISFLVCVAVIALAFLLL